VGKDCSSPLYREETEAGVGLGEGKVTLPKVTLLGKSGCNVVTYFFFAFFYGSWLINPSSRDHKN
jgi:hypothetical protein